MTKSASSTNSGTMTMPQNRIINTLSVLLALQFALAVVLKLSESKYQPVEPSAPLLACDFNKIAKIIIVETEGDTKKQKILLQKNQQGWSLPDYYGAPAAAKNIEQLLNSLKDLKKGFPITTTADAAERFQVSPKKFRRSVSLYDDHQNATTLYLGSSPSFRSVYVKAPNTDEIYTVELSEFQLSAKPSDWLDKSLADVKPSDITAVDMKDFQVQKIKDKWFLRTADNNRPLHENLAQNLIGTVAHLSVNSILGTKADDAYNLDRPTLSYKVTLSNGTNVNYLFAKRKDNNLDVLKASNKDWYMAVDDWSVSNIKGVSAKSLLKSEQNEERKEKDKKAKS